MAKKTNARIATVQILLRLHKQKGSLASEVHRYTNEFDDQEKRLTQELCYGTCRWYFFLEKQLSELLKKPLKAKDHDIHLVLLLGLYQLQFTRVAPHAAINETVNVVLFFRKQWAKKLVNGVLRSYQRELEKNAPNNAEADENDNGESISTASGIANTANTETLNTLRLSDHQQSHPVWLQKAIGRSWPEHKLAIFTANNQHPPFTLRVNQQHTSADDYLASLNTLSSLQSQQSDSGATKTPFSPVGITLARATDVTALPHFAQGHVSVQDEAAQLSAQLLQLAPQQRVLDACCAPGGKTCHIGEHEPALSKLVALDLEERRLTRVRENLERLAINAEVICGDGIQPSTWWDGEKFDRILLDAPCSATGVIRRHPDIKLLRTPEAVEELAALQLSLLHALWPLLEEGGILVYATCSVLPQENTQVVEQFIQQQQSRENNIVHDVIDATWGLEQPYGRQLLPQTNGHDGFYYARLIKRAQ